MKTNPKRIIFLDFDGVICTMRSCLADGQNRWRMLDPIAIKMIEKLAKKYEMQVVASTTWRFFIDVPLLLQTHGSTLVFHDDWSTERERDRTGSIVIQGKSRGNEIYDWCKKNGDPDVMLILDDDKDMTPDQIPYCVFTDVEDGILSKHYAEAEKIIERQLKDGY